MRISAGEGRFRIKAFLSNASDDDLRSEGLDPDGTHPTPFNPLLVERDGVRLLIDAGTKSKALLAGLAEAGLSPADIDILLLSHAHGDHARGAVGAGFGRVLVSQPEWDHWPPDSAMGKILRELDAEPVPADAEILPGVQLLPVPGHTPGMVAVKVADEWVYTADVIAHPMHVKHPEWHIVSDVDPAQAVATRHAFLERARREDWTLYTYHYPAPCVWRV